MNLILGALALAFVVEVILYTFNLGHWKKHP